MTFIENSMDTYSCLKSNINKVVSNKLVLIPEKGPDYLKSDIQQSRLKKRTERNLSSPLAETWKFFEDRYILWAHSEVKCNCYSHGCCANTVSRLATDDSTPRDAPGRSENGHVSAVATPALGETDLLLIRKMMLDCCGVKCMERFVKNG